MTTTWRVLLVEDNSFNQMLVAGILEQEGHEVTVASNGSDGLELVEKGSFDVVLMDVEMPEMNGFEATQSIRVREQGTQEHIPIVGLTARSKQGDKERCLEAGMDAYVPKPIKRDLLFATLAQLIEGNVGETVNIPTPAADEVDGFGRQQVLSRLNGNEVLLSELVGIFFEDCPKYLRQIRAALDDGDPEALRRAAHGFKGVVSTLSLSNALASVLELQKLGESSESLEDAESVYTALRGELERLKPIMQAEMND